MTDRPTLTDFLRERLGRNWVIARRSPRVVAQYGADVVCVSPARYKQVERDYRELYGDPHDPVRAEMYRALKAIADAHRFNTASKLPHEIHEIAYRALAAEVARP